MARMIGTMPPLVKLWKLTCLKRVGSVGAVAALSLLAGCQTNTGDPSIENASFVSGSSTDAGNTAQSAGQADTSNANDTYQVRSGDTLYSIAWRHNMKYQDIARLNNIQPPYALSVGQQLRLSDNAPAAEQGGAAAGDGAQTHGLGDDAGPQVQAAQPANTQQSGATSAQQSGAGNAQSGTDGGSNQQNDSWLLPSSNGSSAAQGASGQAASGGAGNNAAAAGVAAGAGAGVAGASAAQHADSSQTPGNTSTSSADGQVAAASQAPKADPSRKYTPARVVHWQWPAKGKVVKTFSEQTNITRGIDISGQRGEPVTAAGPGLVVYAGNGVRGYGNLVIIKHNDEYLTAYAHNDTLKVKEGDVVVAGQQIATMGDTEANQVNLHFEIRQNGSPKDPLTFLPKS